MSIVGRIMKGWLLLSLCICHMVIGSELDIWRDAYGEPSITSIHDPMVGIVERIFWEGPMQDLIPGLAKEGKVDGLDTTFLKTFKRGDTLPNAASKYIDQVVETNKQPLGYGFTNTLICCLATLRFVETGDSRYLLRTENRLWLLASWFLKEKSPIFVLCLRQTIIDSLKEASKKFPFPPLSGNPTGDEGENEIRVIDMCLEAYSVYRQTTGDAALPKSKIFSLWLHLHSCYFLNPGEAPIKWSEFAKKQIDWNMLNDFRISKVRLGPMFNVYNNELKGSEYDQILKKMFGNDYEWKAYVRCSDIVAKIDKAAVEKTLANYKKRYGAK